MDNGDDPGKQLRKLSLGEEKDLMTAVSLRLIADTVSRHEDRLNILELKWWQRPFVRTWIVPVIVAVISGGIVSLFG